MLRRPALIPTLILALGLTPALAEEPNLSPGTSAAEGAASKLVLAQRVYLQAMESGDPVLMLAAIRLARGVVTRPAPGWARTPAGTGELTVPEGPLVAGGPAALSKLKGLVVDDPDLQDLVYDLDAQVPQDRLPVATVATAGLSGGAEDFWQMPLSGSVPAEVALIGDGATALGLTVTDESGAVVCARPATTDPALCRFTPARNGFFSVRIANLGTKEAAYLLIGN
ncbi:MAG: hypothetical protein J0L76_19560 [Rhodobacterales bacterium]|nr:hypothetical protein [Rhodobacterales bacterium]